MPILLDANKLLVNMLDELTVSSAVTLFVVMLLLTMTRFDVTMLDARMVFTSRLQVLAFDVVKLEVDTFEVLMVVLLMSPMTSIGD